MNLYCYVGNNPVNGLDPFGNDIYIIRNGIAQHRAVAIDLYDDKGKWVGIVRYDFSALNEDGVIEQGINILKACVPVIRCASAKITSSKAQKIDDLKEFGDYIEKTYDTTVDDDQWLHVFVKTVSENPPNYSFFGYNCNNFVNSVVEAYNERVAEASGEVEKEKPSYRPTVPPKGPGGNPHWDRPGGPYN